MRALYKYNEATCQYERVKVQTPDVVFYMSGVLVTSIALLVAMLFVHDYFIDSEKEISLRSENHALAKNQIRLSAELDEIDETLVTLEEKDRALHTKFFGTTLESPPLRETASRKILLADATGFRKTISDLSTRSNKLLYNSEVTTAYFSGKLSVDHRHAEKLIALPTLTPIKAWNNDHVVSGFGMRINPFHKGLYEHPGIDIASPRGTEVIATAGGTIIESKKSELQAGYGNFIEIDHGGGFVTRYAHLESVSVRARQRIAKGAVIGTVGSSGGSVAPHLHYEVLKNGKSLDPVYFMVEGVTSEMYQGLRSISQKQNQSLD